MNIAPIILFIYNRPETLHKTLESLSNNNLAKDSVLYVYADGAKPSASEQDIKKIQEAREIVKSKQWCQEVYVIERENNLGLASSIIIGVTEIVNKYGKVIVLEDDLLLSPYFLMYMNEALAMYEKEQKVWSIGACNFFSTNTPETFFIPIPDCWGWATWKDRWQYFEPDSNKLLQQLKEKNLEEAFNLYGSYDFLGMLEAQAKGTISSWAIRWQAQAYLHNALSLYPKYALTNLIESTAATHISNFSLDNHIVFPNEKIKVERQEVVLLNKIEKEMHEWYENNFNKTVKKQMSTISKKQILKKFIPPIFLEIYRYVLGAKKNEISIYQEKTEDITKNLIYWEGNYTSWEDALKKAEGYDAPQILAKVRESTLKVKNGEAVYERDSFIFDEIQYNWALLACLLRIVIENNNELNIIDFGGSLGSSYFQNIHFLNSAKKINWYVVEQEHFVECGKTEIANHQLNFSYTIEECIANNKIDVLLLSGVIQNLDKPYEWIEKFISYDFQYIIIDRTAFLDADSDRLTIQHVPEIIYKASYPAWFFNEKKFLEVFQSKYTLIAHFDPHVGTVIYLEDNIKASYKGFIFIKK
jgi:putative methyltransferase (TIGR04325 family)